MSITTSAPIVPLELLQPNEIGRIVEIAAADDWKHRLAELGLREGVMVKMVQPGEPCLIAVDGHRFSFRCDPATIILVETGPPTV